MNDMNNDKEKFRENKIFECNNCILLIMISAQIKNEKKGSNVHTSKFRLPCVKPTMSISCDAVWYLPKNI